MPTSFWNHISEVVDYVRQRDPKTILEIGIGFGKWGHLFREYLEIYNYLRWKKEDWKIRIDGVEIYEPYITEAIRYYYDNIYLGDIAEMINFLPDYDLIIMMDVLEHLKKDKGVLLLQAIMKKCKTFILSIPLGDWTYEFKGENKAESHISIWTKEEFIAMKMKVINLYKCGDKEIGVFYYET